MVHFVERALPIFLMLATVRAMLFYREERALFKPALVRARFRTRTPFSGDQLGHNQ